MRPATPIARIVTSRRAIVAALLAAHWLLAVIGVRNKCVTYDEIAHLTRGYSYLKLGDFRLGPPHPPFAHYWAALPLMGMNLRFPSLDQDAWRRSDVWSIGRQFFYSPSLRNDSDAMLWRGRAMIALLSAGLGLIVYGWSRRLFGDSGGLISLTLYAFSPTMLAHGSLVTTDLASAFFFVASMGALWRVSHRVSWGTLIVAVLSVGGMFLAKGSGVLMAFMGAVLIAVRLVWPRPLILSLRGAEREIRSPQGKLAVLSALTALLIVTTAILLWAGYGFRWQPFRDGASTTEGYQADAVARRCDYFSASPPPPGKSAWEHQMRGLDEKKAGLCRWLHEARLLPDAYVYGFLSMLQSARGRDAFFNGERSLYGWPYRFFPYAFLIKTPLPLFAMLALALLGAALLGRRVAAPEPSAFNAASIAAVLGPRELPRRGLLESLYVAAPLWVLIIVYSVASIRSTLNIGHRHLLPLYPALFILAGAAARWRLAGAKPVRYVPAAMLVLFVAASLSVYPHSLAYFNSIVGGPRYGYKHLVDSSLDWGQDLPGLADWLQGRGLLDGRQKPVYLKYFGMGHPPHEGIAARDIYKRLAADRRGDYRLTGGVYCISATALQQVYVWDLTDSIRIGLLDESRKPLLPIEWNEKLEAAYQQLLPTARRFEALPDEESARRAFQWTGVVDVDDAYYRHQKLRFMRLCAHLRRREPSAMIGYSILIYDLSDADVERMVYGAAP